MPEGTVVGEKAVIDPKTGTLVRNPTPVKIHPTTGEILPEGEKAVLNPITGEVIRNPKTVVINPSSGEVMPEGAVVGEKAVINAKTVPAICNNTTQTRAGSSEDSIQRRSIRTTNTSQQRTTLTQTMQSGEESSNKGRGSKNRYQDAQLRALLAVGTAVSGRRAAQRVETRTIATSPIIMSPRREFGAARQSSARSSSVASVRSPSASSRQTTHRSPPRWIHPPARSTPHEK
eukprot:TRINITY_DN340_c0_g1_i9.p1 TRINITY_DN340_c0_g1~~TRINITY_DN340_c0_g1_i9.p1  ORF type:complete len:232 (+),score=47.11 TRINITY_DN340_c0_g1_i9:190-885(+)